MSNPSQTPDFYASVSKGGGIFGKIGGWAGNAAGLVLEASILAAQLYAKAWLDNQRYNANHRPQQQNKIYHNQQSSFHQPSPVRRSSYSPRDILPGEAPKFSKHGWPTANLPPLANLHFQKPKVPYADSPLNRAMARYYGNLENTPGFDAYTSQSSNESRPLQGNQFQSGIQADSPVKSAYNQALENNYLQNAYDQMTAFGPIDNQIASKENSINSEGLNRLFQAIDKTLILAEENESNNGKTSFFSESRYYPFFSNFPAGKKSFETPKQLEIPNDRDYYYQALFGEGQSIKTSIYSINLTKNKLLLKQSILGIGEFKSNTYNPLPHLLEEFKHTHKPVKVVIPTVLFQTEAPQTFGIGKVKLEFEGILHKNKSGQTVLSGLIRQGRNHEMLTFPAGHRGLIKETLTAIGRNMPFTVFETIITGEKSIEIIL